MSANGEFLSPLEAAAAIRTFEGRETAIRRRTSGLMWMVWGFIAPAIFFTFGYVSLAAGAPSPWFALLWVPWVASGLTFSFLLWRSAALLLPRETVHAGREVAVHGALFVGLVVGGALLLHALSAPFHPPAGALAGMGIVAMVMGATGIFTVDATDRRLRFASGAALLIVAVVASAAMAGTDHAAARTALAAVGALASGLAFFITGLLLVLRA